MEMTPRSSKILRPPSSLSEPQAIRDAYTGAVDEWLAAVQSVHSPWHCLRFTTTAAPPVRTLYSLMGHDTE